AYVYGSYPDIDALFREQAAELDQKRREAILHKIQQLVHERTIYAHILQIATIAGVGPRVGESGIGLLVGHPYSTPYVGITLAGKEEDADETTALARSGLGGGACAWRFGGRWRG